MNRIGIDLGGTKIEGIVLSENNKILKRTRVPTPNLTDENSTYRAVATVINILNPHTIVLGGGLSNLDILYDRGRQAIEPHICGSKTV